MRIAKAVITAAAPGQQTLPLQSVVDRQGQDRTALQLILQEAVDAGAEEICMVISPNYADAYRQAAGEHAGRLCFTEQDTPRGYGHALHSAKAFVGNEPFLHLVGDHLYLSRTNESCAAQLVKMAQSESCSVSAVQATHERRLPYFGAISAKRISQRNDVYEINKVIEKPTPTLAEQELIVAGLRSSHYLCLFGLHVLSPLVFEILDAQIQANDGNSPVLLSPALSALAQQERYFALEVQGSRYNIGVKYGLLMAQLALSLSGDDRDQILTELVELVASRHDRP